MTETAVKVSPHEIIFSLDIGTRNVVGIVGKKEEEKFIILEVEMMEHPSRAMYDGQIHDIDKVASTAKRVKENLERKLGFELKQVAIAAAGRALKTYRVTVDREADITKEIDKAMIDSLELEGIQKAQQLLEQEEESRSMQYYCVGYTVVNYYLNGSTITSLKGHRGNIIGADVLATFLPHVVVNGLYTVMNNIGLEVMNLTLEPIAAINVAIPPKLRLLNLALIDIGAGTSDIALTRDGTIVAYAMASVAGDEITEAIAKSLLLDFNTAEKLKLELNKKDTHTFQDIVGIPYTMTTQEIIERISAVIENLANEIAEKILEYNGKAPSAVFCIGGGSQIPSLTAHLSSKLGLPKERVVVRGTEIIENVEFVGERLEGPEFITPIGIGIIAHKEREQDFLQVTINGQIIKLFNSKPLLISDTLILIGYNARKLIARRGKGLSFTLNGIRKTIFGEHGEPAKIYLNGKLSSLDTKISNGDSIVVEEATDGKGAKASIQDVVEHVKIVDFNGKSIKLIEEITINGKKASWGSEVQDGDEIVVSECSTVGELLRKYDMSFDQYDIYANGIAVGKDYRIQHYDVIRTQERTEHLEERSEIMEETALDVEEEVHGSIEVMVNNSPIKIKSAGASLIFIDIFNYYHFDTTKPKGTLHLILNGNKANYTDEIKHGDVIEIFWTK